MIVIMKPPIYQRQQPFEGEEMKGKVVSFDRLDPVHVYTHIYACISLMNVTWHMQRHTTQLNLDYHVRIQQLRSKGH